MSTTWLYGGGWGLCPAWAHTVPWSPATRALSHTLTSRLYGPVLLGTMALDSEHGLGAQKISTGEKGKEKRVMPSQERSRREGQMARASPAGEAVPGSGSRTSESRKGYRVCSKDARAPLC